MCDGECSSLDVCVSREVSVVSRCCALCTSVSEDGRASTVVLLSAAVTCSFGLSGCPLVDYLGTEANTNERMHGEVERSSSGGVAEPVPTFNRSED